MIESPSIIDIEFFHKKYFFNHPNDCWEWTCGKFSNGYGQFWFKTQSISAHRFMFFLTRSDFNQDLQVLHLCNNKSCVNPAHLYLGTHDDNMRDVRNEGIKKGEMNAASKLSDNEVLEIREKYKTGCFSQRTLARMYSVTQAMVCYIVNKKNWTHV